MIARAGATRHGSRDFWRLLSVVKPYRLPMSVALASLLASSACGLALPQLLRLLIDAALVQRDGSKLNQTMFLLVAVLSGRLGARRPG